uniref:Transcriptional regulator n=2 Tax=Litorilinea aerophila TaxID=1204385 RepID=A0A540VIY4_9CHLR
MRAVAARGIEIAAITDHNTVAGIAAIRREVEWLTRLEATNRLTDEERERLREWRELADKVLVLPGFEFTATFGFHILGIFPPETSVRQLEHILLTLNVPADKLDEGSTETGASTDVLTAYKVIREAGGLVIAAHANSTHGVAMRNFPFGGQTKIAYTQDANLDALEVTDLDKRYRSTARFFNGSKNEYPRRMHCIQGSDAHRITADPKNPKRLGIGDRMTEFLLDSPTFESLQAVLRSKQFDRTRPVRPKDNPFDPIVAAREEGPSLVQSFHESASQRGGRLTAILSDICAFANTMGGTIYIGASPRKGKPSGLAKPAEVQQQIQEALEARLTPPLEVKFEVVQSQGAKVLRIQVPKGPDRPYCLDDFKFYVRDESETSLAVRDEIVALIREAVSPSSADQRERSSKGRDQRRERSGQEQRNQAAASQNGSSNTATGSNGSDPASVDETSSEDAFYLPQIGVEIVETVERNGKKYHSIHDLRNGHIIKNVTRKGARKLWNYAIQCHEDRPVDPQAVKWHGDIGLIKCEKRAGKLRYDLALRENGHLRVFYGVTEDGMEGRWSVFIQDE